MEFGFLSPLYALLKDGISWISRRFEKPDPVELLKKRQEWRQKFESYFKGEEFEHAYIYGSAIIREVSRMDAYPDCDEREKGISPWFKVEVKGLYHRGVEVFLRIITLKHEEEHEGWRYAHHEEEGAFNAFLVGRIPFDRIKYVNWDGDEYYYFPHIYCDFLGRPKEPYEELLFFVKQEVGETTYFTEIADYKSVKRLSKKLKCVEGSGRVRKRIA
jgi:hypothetical protein